MLRSRLLILVLAISAGLISCKNNPASSDQPLQYKITGKIINNYPDTPGPIWDVKVILISGSDSITTKTNDKGVFEYVKDSPFKDDYKIKLQKFFYKDEVHEFTFPDSSLGTGIFDAGTFKMEISNESLFIAGEIERSVEDDSVVVKFTSSTGCYNSNIGPESDRSQRQNIGNTSIFSIAINKTCEEIYLTIEGQRHRKTRMYPVNLSNKEVKESPNRIDGLSYKIYEDDDPIKVTVAIRFYTIINGEKHLPVLHGRESFDITRPNAAAMYFKPDEKGEIEIEAFINEGADTLSVVKWNRQDLHYLNRMNFPLLDYEISTNNRIDLGEHELEFDGVYIYGSLSDHFYDYKGDFQLSVDSESYRLNENKEFIFPSPSTSNSYLLELESDYYENIDTVITRDNLVADGDIYTGLNIDLTPTLYQIFVEVNFIDLDGSHLPLRAVPVDFPDGRVMTDKNGIAHIEVNKSRPVVYPFVINIKDENNSLDDFTSQPYEVDLSSHNNYKLNKQAAIYKLGPLVDYTPSVQVGTIWEFNYSQGIHTAYANSLVHEGELTWEITEALTDSTFILHESFDGTQMYYSAGEEHYSDSNLSDAEYLVTVNNRKIKFEPQGSPAITFTKELDYELDMYQPSTYIKEYVLSERIQDEFNITTISTTFSEYGGIKKFNYYLQDYDSKFVNASLKSFIP